MYTLSQHKSTIKFNTLVGYVKRFSKNTRLV